MSELIQDYPALADHAQQYKHLCYSYDLISGNVHQVMYQHNPITGAGKADQFFHQYYYDADNRITNVYTSIDSIIWEQDQKYFYYLHGPLGRSETGDVKVQGTDYAYTIHGWIKGVNANTISSANDIGKDAHATNNTAYNSRAGMHSNIGLDAFGYVLGYYWNGTTSAKDWKPINTAAQSLYADSYTLTNTSDDLYNGNIKEMTTALSKPNGTSNPALVSLMFNRYRYDQLNRIKSQNSYTGTSTSTYIGLTNTGEYNNTFTYDAAGNIATQFRNGNTASGQSMDDLDYYYYTNTGGTYSMNASGGAPVNATNKLAYVDDAGTAGNYTDDLEDQSAGNYEYDAIGNLTKDVIEQIEEIDWNVYGKIKTIRREGTSSKSDLLFEYDAFGNRVGKIVKTRSGSGYQDQDQWSYTYYVRDASGNVMATYTRSFTPADESELEDKLSLSETHLYGASRIGIKDREAENIYSSVTKTYSGTTDGAYNITGVSRVTAMASPDLTTPERTLGNKQFEFGNHLGNVLVTLSDRKVQVNASGNISYFTSDVLSYADYSAFGAQLAGRHGGSYRYTFNAKETDTESDLQDYGMRIYNPRLGKFLSVDPLTRSYPELTPYQFASNTPVQAIDLDGLEMYHYTLVFDEKGKAILSYSHTEDIIERQFSWSFKNFGWNNVVNERREVIVHSGQYYEGQYNGQIVTQEINFHYSDPDPHLTEAHALTQKDINDCIESYRWMGRVAQGLANVHESYRESRPGRSNAFEADYRELRKMNMGSPFKGKTIPEIKSAMDNKVVKGDLTMMYDNPKTGAKAYFNPSSRFSYNVDPGINSRGEQVESPHVDVNYPTARRGDVKKVKHYLDGKKDYIRK